MKLYLYYICEMVKEVQIWRPVYTLSIYPKLPSSSSMAWMASYKEKRGTSSIRFMCITYTYGKYIHKVKLRGIEKLGFT